MPATAAQIKASQINGARSRGPKTLEGKAVSRGNAFKHGLTGAGVVLPVGDMEAIEIRADKLIAEMRPTTEMGAFLVRQVAVLSVRMTRCTEQAVDVVNTQVDRALRGFDDARLDEVERLFDALPGDPSISLRKLLRTEEGIQRLLNAWTNLKEDLEADRWKSCHGLRLAHLKGYRPDDCDVAFLIDLSEMVQGRSTESTPTPVDIPARVQSAKGQLLLDIELEIEALTASLGQIDPAEYEADRLEVIARARLDAASDVHQIQKYEAATERSLFRTLKEARLVEQAPALIDQTRTKPTKPSNANRSTATTSAPSGSFSQIPVQIEPVPPEDDDTPLTPEERAEVEAFFISRGMPLPPRPSEVGKVGQVVTPGHRTE